MTRIFTKCYIIWMSFLIAQQTGIYRSFFLMVKCSKNPFYQLFMQTLYLPTLIMMHWQTSPFPFPVAVSCSKAAAFSKVLTTPISFVALTDLMASLPGTWMSSRGFYRRPHKRPIGRQGVTEPCRVSTSLASHWKLPLHSIC